MTPEDLKLGYASESELDKIVKRNTRKRMIDRGEFPAPVQVSEGRVGTLWARVFDWMEKRPPSQMKSPNPKTKRASA